jgi:hypothetical protein
MALDPISMGVLGLSGFQAYQQHKAGEEAQAAYNAQANEMVRQANYAAREGLEQQHEMTVEARKEVGHLRSRAGGSGLRVGGSVATMTQAVARRLARRKALVNMDVQEGYRRTGVIADQYRKAGRSARSASNRAAFGSLLTGGLATYRYLKDRGKLGLGGA